jgi:hypothetical protein
MKHIGLLKIHGGLVGAITGLAMCSKLMIAIWLNGFILHKLTLTIKTTTIIIIIII